MSQEQAVEYLKNEISGQSQTLQERLKRRKQQREGEQQVVKGGKKFMQLNIQMINN